jgi:hypothetical protein
MLGGTVGLMVTLIRAAADGGGVPPQPHINTSIESANASFFIDLCLPFTVTHSSKFWEYPVYHSSGNTGSRPQAGSLMGKMMKLMQTLPRTPPGTINT